MQITCKNCGSIDDYRTEQKSNNLVATCNTCNRFIKNIPTSKPTMFVGKYKGKPIEEIDDLPYLKWAHDNMNNVSTRAKQAMSEQITSLSNLLR